MRMMLPAEMFGGLPVRMTVPRVFVFAVRSTVALMFFITRMLAIYAVMLRRKIGIIKIVLMGH